MNKSHYIEGQLQGQGLRFAIVQSRFNDFFSDRLTAGACDALRRHGCDDITIAKVPGAFELPVTAKALIESGKYDAIIALGVLIKGDTPHFEHISSVVTSALSALTIDHNCPVSFGVLTTNTIEQSLERSGCKAGNKGAEAAMAALETVQVLRQIRG